MQLLATPGLRVGKGGGVAVLIVACFLGGFPLLGGVPI